MLLLEAIFLMLQGSECLVSSFLHLRILLSEWGGGALSRFPAGAPPVSFLSRDGGGA